MQTFEQWWHEDYDGATDSDSQYAARRAWNAAINSATATTYAQPGPVNASIQNLARSMQKLKSE